MIATSATPGEEEMLMERLREARHQLTMAERDLAAAATSEARARQAYSDAAFALKRRGVWLLISLPFRCRKTPTSVRVVLEMPEHEVAALVALLRPFCWGSPGPDGYKIVPRADEYAAQDAARSVCDQIREQFGWNGVESRRT